jgi:cytochrome c-type biogenesis protein
MFDVSIWGAFVGGLVVFFSPCILPIVPFYLSYMAGTGMATLNADGDLPANVERKAVVSSVMFSAGIITVFVLLGAAAFSVSQSFKMYQDEFRYASAAIIAVIGLHFLGVIKIGFLNRQFQVNAGDTNNMSLVGSYVVGLAFAAGWTPCVGGVLTAVIMTASFEDTAMKGVGLLFIFGVGLTLPFVIAAFFIKPFLKFAARFRRHMGLVEKVMGLLMLTFALLLITNRINEIANWMIETFPAFTSL